MYGISGFYVLGGLCAGGGALGVLGTFMGKIWCIRVFSYVIELVGGL